MKYLTASAVAKINEIEIGPNLVGDQALLESAVARPRQSVGGEDAYPDIHTKAAALSTIWFYGLNGYWFSASNDELVDFAVDVVEGRCRGVEAIAERLKEFTFELPVANDSEE